MTFPDDGTSDTFKDTSAMVALKLTFTLTRTIYSGVVLVVFVKVTLSLRKMKNETTFGKTVVSTLKRKTSDE